jgi:outer membrane receptor for ferrienterochelin and colicins
VSWQHAQDALDWQSSVTSRYSTLSFTPDAVGDLLYDGIAQWAYKRDVALGWQTDAPTSSTMRTPRAPASTCSTTMPPAAQTRWCCPPDGGVQTGEVPETIPDNGSQAQWIESLYLQDEWTIVAPLTLNYGLRLDHYNAYSSGTQLSPRLNAVWQPIPGTTLHAGYSRYFTPPPFELIASETFAKFANTSAIPNGAVTADTRPVAERESYYDVGAQQKLLDGLTLGIDSYYRRSQNLIDEGQFGAPIILTPFNYLKGKIEGIEFTGNYVPSTACRPMRTSRSRAPRAATSSRRSSISPSRNSPTSPTTTSTSIMNSA